jgi:hypothetical protein
MGISYVFESVSWKVVWKVSCVQGIYVFESVSWKQTLQNEVEGIVCGDPKQDCLEA